jgi:hypothetical protein
MKRCVGVTEGGNGGGEVVKAYQGFVRVASGSTVD